MAGWEAARGVAMKAQVASGSWQTQHVLQMHSSGGESPPEAKKIFGQWLRCVLHQILDLASSRSQTSRYIVLHVHQCASMFINVHQCSTYSTTLSRSILSTCRNQIPGSRQITAPWLSRMVKLIAQQLPLYDLYATVKIVPLTFGVWGLPHKARKIWSESWPWNWWNCLFFAQSAASPCRDSDTHPASPTYPRVSSGNESSKWSGYVWILNVFFVWSIWKGIILE